jgi:protein O-GlcNAc transferase
VAGVVREMNPQEIQQALESALEHHRAGRLGEAEVIYRKVLSADAQNPDAWHLLGLIAHQVGRNDAAIELVSRAIGLKPDFGQAHHTLGNVMRQLGRNAEALPHLQAATQLLPASADAPNDLGTALYELGRVRAAAAAYSSAIRVKPDFAPAHNNLASAQRDMGQLDDALASYRRALELNPRLPQVHANIGNVLRDQGLIDEALASYRAALELNPGFAEAHSNLLHALYLHPSIPPEAILAEHRKWNSLHAAGLGSSRVKHTNNRDPERRLKIGYVSPDLREHPVARFLLPILVHHDHSKFEVFCYSDALAPDSLTDRVRAAADSWHVVCGVSHADLASTIRSHGIDILVDLALHSANNRMLTFARKPAPVQVSYLGYPGTTGLSAMDYRLTDPHLDPEENDVFYTERSIRLPQSYWCYQPPAAAPDVAALPARSSGHVTFGCLNNFAKVSRPALEAWAQILQRVPGSRLILYSLGGSHRDRVRDLFAQRGVSGERIEFVDRVQYEDYLRTYQRFDVALDSFPYSGGTTTCDALWMGVPVVSLAGRLAVHRAGVSILSILELDELVASDVEGYIQIAVTAAPNLERLDELRRSMRDRMAQSALVDAPGFTRALEEVFRQTWRAWCMPET